jgi:hypothetical protein
MGQAASYAESSVQRALLKLKHEEQAEEDELLHLCGYRRPSPPETATAPLKSGELPPTHAPVREGDIEARLPHTGSYHDELPSSSSPLPPPPDSFGPFVSLAPEYYSLDELRDALRYLPDTLWVSLYRVSLLYILDNDHDGRVKSTDISFFMDWSIKTVGRDVPPEQLAEVLQTYAALHCWRRCLHAGEEAETERAAQQSGRGGGSGGGGGARNRRRPLPGCPGNGPAPFGHHHHHNPQSQSVAPFMLLHLRESFFSSRPGGPVQMTTTNAKEGADGEGGFTSQAAMQYSSPRSAITKPVTSTTRLEAAAHFAEWMLRLVQNQERDRRHERQRFERRLRLLATPEMKLCNSRLRHSQYLPHYSTRLRGGSLPMFPSTADAAEGEDVIVTSQSCMPPSQPGVNMCDEETEVEVVAMMAPRLSLPDNDVVVGLGGFNTSSSNSQLASAMVGGGGDMPAHAAPPASRALPTFPYSSTVNPPTTTTRQSGDSILITSIEPMKEGGAQTAAGPVTLATAAAAGVGAADVSTNSTVGYSPSGTNPAAAFPPYQVAALLMDSEAFYVELEKNGWCTIGAVEEAYLDFAVEDSYCLSFWAFCRLLNEASADEVQNALDLTTAQATAVLTSAAAVEDHRRAAAARQLQRVYGGGGGGMQRIPSQMGGWERQVEVVPLFIVSEYTFLTFVAAFIHAYWDMLESMGVDAVTQPMEVAPVATACSTASPGFRTA